MPKRKRMPHLPPGWGCIRFIGKNRRLPYAVHPPATERDAMGRYIRPSAICYVPDWYTGFAVLSAYHAGTYTPGMELAISQEVQNSTSDLDAFCQRVLKTQAIATGVGSSCPTFGDTFEKFIEWKFGENAARTYGKGTKRGYTSPYNAHLQCLKDIPLDKITLNQLQDIVNACECGKGVRSRIVFTLNAVYKYAVPRHLCEENPAAGLVIPHGRDPKHGEPFTDEELITLWKNKNDDMASTLLVMIYSGFRIGALQDLEVNLEEMYFKGGIKSAAGKNRVVPIHSAIQPIVRNLIEKNGTIAKWKYHSFRLHMIATFDRIGISQELEHTPHDCRHTFSALCERFGVREADRKRLLGHSFGGDVTNAVYGHRTLEELRREIEKIKLPKGIKPTK